MIFYPSKMAPDPGSGSATLAGGGWDAVLEEHKLALTVIKALDLEHLRNFKTGRVLHLGLELTMHVIKSETVPLKRTSGH